MNKKLEDIIEDYYNLREDFKHFIQKGDDNKNTLLEFQHRFIEIKADLRPFHYKMIRESEKRSDKAATAIKMRLAVSMIKDEYVFEDGETPMYSKPPTMSNADKFAAATKEYKEFLKQKVFYKESLINIADLREDITNYTTLINNKLK